MGKPEKLSCVDCFALNCDGGNSSYPDFCLTTGAFEAVKEEAMKLYEEETNQKIMQAAASVECDGYCQWSRLEEIIEFAKRLQVKKIGIATCVGLIRESRILTKVLRSHGFDVYGAVCKVGAVPKVDVGIDERCNEVGCEMCNPISQAKLLNHEGTELNIVVGLCVGHDSLFYKYSEAITTTLITKERVTGHNPAAAIYNAESYYKAKLMGDE